MRQNPFLTREITCWTWDITICKLQLVPLWHPTKKLGSAWDTPTQAQSNFLYLCYSAWYSLHNQVHFVTNGMTVFYYSQEQKSSYSSSCNSSLYSWLWSISTYWWRGRKFVQNSIYTNWANDWFSKQCLIFCHVFSMALKLNHIQTRFVCLYRCHQVLLIPLKIVSRFIK